MNNFRRSVAEIVQVVKIADSTIRKRLEEFKKTGSAALSVGDFRSVWLEEENEPPAFVRGREKEERERLALEGDEGEEGEQVVKGGKGKGKGKTHGKGKKRKRKREEDTDDEAMDVDLPTQQDEFAPAEGQEHATHVFDPALLQQGILAGTTNEPLFLPEDYTPQPEGTLVEDEQTLVNHTAPSDNTQASSSNPKVELREATPIEASLDAALTEEVSSFLEDAKGAQLSEALDDADAQRVAGFTGDQELEGLDEEELDAFLLTEEEVRMKERVWVEMNRDYLENLAGGFYCFRVYNVTNKC